ncbi:zinc finger protein 260 [Stomoxys calcitrans]|uniref:zinc finger protein 260 n=1 Tax=Stomoxys calcitrans TaxID=35570 RepID=UPI0027E27FCE|nr:zinc finger protein 260 [Stomoxys calcitrans]
MSSLLGRICRTCLLVSPEMYNFQDMKDGNRIIDMLNQIVTIDVFCEDDLETSLPREICLDCCEKLHISHNFQQMCIVNNKKIRSLIRNQEVEKLCDIESKESAKDFGKSRYENKDRFKLEDNIKGKYDNIVNVRGGLICLKLQPKNRQEQQDISVNNSRTGMTDNNVESEEDEDNVPLSVLRNREDEGNSEIVHRTSDSHNKDKQKFINKCDLCVKEFSSNKLLQKHKRSKHVQNPTSVKEKHTNNISTNNGHIQEFLDSNDDDMTIVCNSEFDEMSASEEEDHTLVIEKNAALPHNYPCTECQASFRFQKQLERHIKKHNEAHRFVCITCNDRFKYPFMLKKHIETHHQSEKSKSKITKLKKDNVEKPHECKYCPSAYTNVGGLAQHMSKKHPEIVPFKCDRCEKTFVVEEHLKIHTNRHMGIKNFKCELCEKSFSFKFAMKQHMRIHTGDLNYLCTLCGKKFYRPSNLRQHMQRHGDEKPYTCPNCPKRFKCPSDRYIHLMTHQEGKNHVCSTCGARFSRVDTLQQHQILHTGQKPYKCDQCPMAFPRLMNLNRHLRTHTGEKPYKCKYCNKSYAQSNDLNKHLRTHLGENTYICTQCPAAFKYQADLKTHVGEHYRKQKEEEQRSNAGNSSNETTINNTAECNE